MKLMVLFTVLSVGGCATDEASYQRWHNLNTDMQLMDMRLQQFNQPVR